MIKLILLLVLFVIIAVIVAAVKLLPWWGAILVLMGLAVGLVYCVPALIRVVVKRAFFGMMESKSKVLRGASVTVHSIERVGGPPDEPSVADQEDDDEDADPEEADWAAQERARRASHHWYRIDATIEPRAAEGPMTHWEPGELLVVPFDRKVDIQSMMAREDAEDEDDSGGEDEDWQVDCVRLLEDGLEREDDQYKYDGPLQLRLWFGVPPTAPRRLKFQYYFESFGDLTLPSA